MALSNHERVGKALDLLREGLRPSVARELEAKHGWQLGGKAAFARLPDGAPDHVVRTVTENGWTLKFADNGFERE
jgi:hypothetical protein